MARYSATAPVTCGVAIEVPLISLGVSVPPAVMPVDLTQVPGAMMSTTDP